MHFTNLIIDPPVIAHRGASRLAPENTLAAFRKAKELGARWVEFDVMLAADDEIMVIHDFTLNRTTNGKGKVIRQTYNELKILDAGGWFNPTFLGEKIPTLLEVMALLNELQLCANIEIKARVGFEEQTVTKVLQLIQLHWENEQFPPLLSSFSLPVLESLRKQSSSSLIGMLLMRWNKHWEKIADQLQCVSVHVNHRVLTPLRINAVKATQRPVLAYTVNDPQRAKELFAWGVDAVFSDDVPSILSCL